MTVTSKSKKNRRQDGRHNSEKRINKTVGQGKKGGKKRVKLKKKEGTGRVKSYVLRTGTEKKKKKMTPPSQPKKLHKI